MHSCRQNPEQSRMVLAYTHKDVNALNKAIKAEMVKVGKVSRQNTDLTITTQQDAQETQGFAKGDRIMFRENNRDLGVMNGTLATIAKIHGHIVDVRLDNGQDLRFNAKDYSKFQLGYAATVHKSQGVTVDEAFVLASRHFDRHTTYVVMTRHRHNVRLYAGKDDFHTTTKLIDTLSKDGQNISSLDFAAPAPTQMGKRKQSLLDHKRALICHQRKEREALAEQQKQRRIQEHAAHKAMQPRGLKAV
jgi:ATP-dependent exoDNAse (exonuclease V) alpha subunit